MQASTAFLPKNVTTSVASDNPTVTVIGEPYVYGFADEALITYGW
jgi:hypothetical protein